jgi:hypothetical protein
MIPKTDATTNRLAISYKYSSGFTFAHRQLDLPGKICSAVNRYCAFDSLLG